MKENEKINGREDTTADTPVSVSFLPHVYNSFISDHGADTTFFYTENLFPIICQIKN